MDIIARSLMAFWASVATEVLFLIGAFGFSSFGPCGLGGDGMEFWYSVHEPAVWVLESAGYRFVGDSVELLILQAVYLPFIAVVWFGFLSWRFRRLMRSRSSGTVQ